MQTIRSRFPALQLRTRRELSMSVSRGPSRDLIWGLTFRGEKGGKNTKDAGEGDRETERGETGRHFHLIIL